MQITNLYETDFYAWTQRQSTLLRQEEFEAVDWNNLIEEIETLGRSEQNELESRLQVVPIKHQIQAMASNPCFSTKVSSLSDAPAGCLSPRSHLLTKLAVTLR